MGARILVARTMTKTLQVLRWTGQRKAEGVQVMLHLIQRESNTDAEGATQVNRKE